MSPSRSFDAELLLSYGAWLSQLARALVAKEDEVDDVVQQTYAQALAQPPRHFGNVRAWLGAIARNVVRARTRSDAARMVREEFAPRPSPAESPEEAIERVELRRAVVDAVLALAEPYRSALVLRFFEELPTSEIARLTKSPQETVKTRVKRGLAQLRSMLSERFSRDGESMMEGLAMLLVPSMGGASVSAGATGGAAKTLTAAGAGIGAGILMMSTTTKLLLTSAAAVAIVIAAWRLTSPQSDAHARAEVVHRADPPLPPPAVVAAPAVAAATRESDELPEPVAAVDATDPAAKPFDFDGRVVDEHGAAVADALVLLGGADANWTKYRMGRNETICTFAEGLLSGRLKPERYGSRGVRSAADGSFRFEKVDGDHSFELAALHESAGVGRAHAPTHGVKEPVVITLTPMIVVRGRVSEVDGRVSAGATLDVSVQYDSQMSGTGGAIVAADGTFRCFWSDIDAAEFTAHSANGRESEMVRLEFGKNAARVRDVALVLPASGGGHCTGRIVDQSGVPLDVTKELLPRLADWERAGGARAGLRLFACSGDSAPTPVYEIGTTVEWGKVDLDAATYDVVLPSAARWIALVARGRTLGAVAVTRANGGAAGPDLVVDPTQLPATPISASIEVRLLDAVSGKPRNGSNAEVELHTTYTDPLQPGVGSGHSSGPSRSDEAAGTTWFDGVHPGHCTLTVAIDGMTPIRQVFDVVARAEPYRVDLSVRAADATLRGIVVDADGKPLAKAHVRLLEKTKSGLDGESIPPMLTNGEGRFIFEKLASGDGVLVVYALPFAPAMLPVKLAADGDAGSIVLASGGRIVVSVTRARGDPTQSSFGSLHVTRSADGMALADSAWERSVDWKTATRFELVLPAGNATLDVTLVDGTKFKRELEVVAGKTLEVAIE